MRVYSSLLLLIALALTGCGRIGYDPLGSLADAGTSSQFDASVSAVVGELDPDFEGGGVVTWDYVDDDMISKDDRATAVAIDPQGRIVLSISGMYLFYASDDQFDMAAITMRLQPDGQPDATYQFGALSVPGRTVDTDSRWSHGNGLLLDGSNIVLAGYREWGGADDPTVYRYQSAGGQPDGFFGTNGVVGIPAAGEVQAWGIARDPTDGNYVIAGGQGASLMFAAKLSAVDGSPVTSFAGNGQLTYDVAGNERGIAVTVDVQGRIYVAGWKDSGGATSDLVVWRYLNDGSVDASFSGDGIFVYDGGDNDEATAIALDSNGDVVVAGFSARGAPLSNDMVVLRIDASTGELDASFGGGGVFAFDGGGERDEAHGLAVSADAIFATGTSKTAASAQAMAVWKLTNDGVLDASFATGGVFQHAAAAGGTVDIGLDVAIDASGELVVVGESLAGDGFFSAALWKVQ